MKKILLCFLSLIFTFCFCDASFNFSSGNSAVKLLATRLYLSTSISGWDGFLEQTTAGGISGNGTITFDDGIFKHQGTPATFTGVYDPDATYGIILAGSKIFRAAPGTIVDRINVLGTGNRLEGQPLFSNSDSIRLENANTDLTIAIQNQLDSNIEMRNGTLKLESDLKLADDRTLTGSGIVQLQGFSFSFGGKELSLTHTVSWNNSTDINLKAKTILSGTWSFKGENVLNGHGNILDLTHGGTLFIEDASNLELTDITIRGLGIDKGWFAFETDSAQINMSNVTIEMENRFNTSLGGIYVEGPTTVITKNFLWTFDQQGSLTVDAVTLWYDTLTYPDNENIRPEPADDSHIALLNGGIIRLVIGEDIGDIYYVVDASDSNPEIILRDLYLSIDRKMYVQANIVFDGKYNNIHFSRSDGSLIEIDATETLTLKNVVLKDFSPAHIAGGGRIMFGDNVTIELATDDQASSGYTFSFDGSCYLNGQGNELDLSTAPKYAIDIYPSSTLVIHDIRLAGLGGSDEHNVRCLHRFSTVEFRNADLMMTANYTFSEGFMNFNQDVEIMGQGHTFAYQSPRRCLIGSDSALLIDMDVTFSYDAGNYDLGIATRRALVFEDASSVLYFDGSTLHSTRTGIELEGGTLVIDNKVTFSSEARYYAEGLVLRTDLGVKVLSGAKFDLYGVIEYK